MRRSRRLLLSSLWLLVAALPVAWADGPPAAPADPSILTLKDLFDGGRSFTKAVPGWRWRPGHVELVQVDRRSVKVVDPATQKPRRLPPRQILVAMDPDTGETRDLLDLTGLDDLIPAEEPGADGKLRKKPVTAMRGIGRGGASRFEWAEGGKQLCAVVRGDLVWVDLETGAKRRLTHTDAPMADLNIAPGGAHVSFSKGSELWVVSTQEGKPYPLTSGGSKTLLNGTLDWVYPEELGFRTAAWWSPDGRHIAYLQMDQAGVPTYRVPGLLPLRSDGRPMFYPKVGDPNPKVRVGVVPVEGGETRWVASVPSGNEEYVVRVGWRPEESSVPWVVTSDRLQRAHTTRLGAGPALYTVKSSAGWVSSSGPRFEDRNLALFRLHHDTLRWVRHRIGSVFNGPPNDPQGFEFLTAPDVEAGSLLHYDAAAGRCLYEGIPRGDVTQGVFVGGPGCDRLVRAPFAQDPYLWTSADVDATGTYALVTTSDAVTPPKTTLVRVASGEVMRVIGDARAETLDAIHLAVPEYGTLPVEGLQGRIGWRLWKPHDFDAQKRYGLIVHVYGGPGSRMVENVWGRGPLLPTMLCQKGFLVLQVDGRGTSGQGDAWMHSVSGRLGLPELEDQVAAVQHILARGFVDPRRVGIWGWSYGGTMTCNALTMRSDVFKVGVAVAPVTDWTLYDSIYTERYMGLPKDNPKGYEETSSTRYAKKMTGRLLLMHGLGDDNVHAQNTLRLVEAFIQAKNTNYEVMLYPKRAHGIEGASLDVFTRLVSFFERHLAP